MKNPTITRKFKNMRSVAIALILGTNIRRRRNTISAIFIPTYPRMTTSNALETSVSFPSILGYFLPIPVPSEKH